MAERERESTGSGAMARVARSARYLTNGLVMARPVATLADMGAQRYIRR